MKLWKRPVIVVSLWAAAFVAAYLGYALSQDHQFANAQEKREEIRRGLAHVEDLATAFRDVGKLVGPSVVNINVRKKAPAMKRTPLDEDMLRKLFPDGHPDPDLPEGLIPHGMAPDEEDALPDQIGTGSGVIMEVAGNKGYILTNNHVAGGAEEMLITLADGREIKSGKLLGADAKTDLAVVMIETDRLPPSKWGNSDDLQKGDWILAFGSPFGYVGSMTHGIVSALNRQAGILGTGGYENFIQVDAPINPGNSGGPLVNMRGEVVGINTAIASRNGGFQGIGFAIPSNQAKVIYAQLKDKGKVVRGWLGVGIGDVAKNQGLAKTFGYDKGTGVLVDQVLPGTPAEGKLKHGDIITQLNGKAVEDVQDLRNAIAVLPPGAEVKMQIFRKGKMEETTVKLGEQPEDVTIARGGRPAPREPGGTVEGLGLRVRVLTPPDAEKHRLDVQSGVIVTHVDRNSPAATAGIRPWDVITEVGDKAVQTTDDFTAALKGADLKKGVRLYVTTPEGSRYVLVTSEK